MLDLFSHLTILRNEAKEGETLERMRGWLGTHERDARIHASDILAPRKAYWKSKIPKPISDHAVPIFVIGKVLHIFLIGAYHGDTVEKIDWASDSGESWSEALQIVYSPDLRGAEGQPIEIKTSRSVFPPKTYKDIELYLLQLLIYMVAENKLNGELQVLYLNSKNKEGKTAPTVHCYDVSITAEDAAAYTQWIITRRKGIEMAKEKDDPLYAYPCEKWQCWSCEWEKECRPRKTHSLHKELPVL